ncbi:MAG: hydroxylamine oxidoreductase [Planctomycetes bacterium]|nr:hydroxylamine oxidoreductase [Planctomycetota bacterium]
MEVARKEAEVGLAPPHLSIPASSKQCVECHGMTTPGIVDHWKGSTHARRGVGCFECHQAERGDADGFDHYGVHIATVVTPRDCARCHGAIAEEFGKSHHAAAGNILASLDNFLAETVEGSRAAFNPHSPTPGRSFEKVNGMASALSGCLQCHGSKVALRSVDGGGISVDDLKPGPDGRPTNPAALTRILKNESGKPLFDPGTWPNTGIGRINLDGSLGSCSACHSRHDFSPRRARQPENCGKCHLGPDHPQKEIYEESKHGVAYRDLREEMNLDAESWVLGKDYSQAPTCASCHMSGNIRNGGRITHDPGERISWTNRPPVSLVMDTDASHRIVTETDPAKRAALIADTSEAKRNRMKEVCSTCHSPDYVNAFYTQYDNLVVLYNEKFAKPGLQIMSALRQAGLISKTEFDDGIEWTWFMLWHHEGRRARHGVSMMAPDYTHWHGMFEVADRFYMHFIPEARELTRKARESGKLAEAKAADAAIDEVLHRPEHAWYVEGAEDQAERIRRAMEERYGPEGGAVLTPEK